jgi:hypothetical protein
MKSFDETIEKAVEKFKKGEIVWTIEMGGMGPGYEQCLQILTWEMVSLALEHLNLVTRETFDALVEPVIKTLDKDLGFSGAMVGVAKQLAFHLVTDYQGTMNDPEFKERHIMFDDKWEFNSKGRGK